MSNQLQHQSAPIVSDFVQPQTLVKTVREFEQVLLSTFTFFPSVVITEIALFAQFKKEECWLCEADVWEEYAAEIGRFTIWASGYYPPEVYACEKCRELRFTWGCQPAVYETAF